MNLPVSEAGTDRRRLRLFLDSNVLTGGLVARWGLDRAVLSLCAARVCRLVLTEIVRIEVETNLLRHASKLTSSEAGLLLDDYENFLQLANSERLPLPDRVVVKASRRIIAHEADVPVLLSAIDAGPDWLLTHNTRHFTPEVAERTGIRIATPIEFFRHMALAIQESRR